MALVTIPAPQQTGVDLAFSQAKQKAFAMYVQLERMHTDLFYFLWKHPSITIEQFLAKYGTDAKALFEVSSLIQQVLAKTNPSYQPLAPLKPVTLNDDGTVTIQEAQ